MNSYNPVDLLFGGMEKLGPGSNEETVQVLRLLPVQSIQAVVDAGCGTGRQTITLAKELQTLIHAVDSYQPFLTALQLRAREAQVDSLIQTHCMDMKDIPDVFSGLNLLWAEGSAYNIGFANALTTWARALAGNGLAVVSELSWLRDDVPDQVRDFFESGYPDMQSVQANVATAENAGYEVLATHTLPDDAWIEGYYEVLEPRAKDLSDHPDPGVRDFALDTIREIETFRVSENSYGYVFYVLRWK